MGQQPEEIGCGILQLNLQRVRVQRPNAHFRGGQFARRHRLGIHDRIQDEGIAGQRRRIQAAAQAVDEVVGRHRIAVGPPGIGA